MKLKKILALPLLVALFASACSIKAGQGENVEASPATISFKANPAILEKAQISATEVPAFSSILKNITAYGSKIITAAAGAGAKYIVTDILKDYGIDMRDPAIPYIEKLDVEVRQVKAKLDSIGASADQYNAERSLDNLYSYASVASTDVMNQVKGGIWKLLTMENDKTKDAKFVEAQRQEYYQTALKNFTVKGSNIADFVTHFAKTIVTPVESSPTNDVFYYYQLSSGQFDKWSTQSYKNRRNFIAYLDSLLLSSANLAIFDNHYRSLGASEAVKATNDMRFQTMIGAVSKANALFQTELKRLDEYETLRRQGELIYLPTDRHYSAKMATYTFNHEDKANAELLKGVEHTNTTIFRKGQKDLQGYLLTYQANHEMVNDVINDYAKFVKAHGLKDYTINHYLKDIGFTAERQDLFDKAEGLYYGELNLPHVGYLADDINVKAHYYDKFGNLQNKTQFFVETHHGLFNRRTYKVDFRDQDYYLCFVKADGTLDGQYWGRNFGKGNENLVDAFGKFLENRVDCNDPLATQAKFQ